MDKTNKKEWTVMFYFASDNPLAPGVVSQLKAIKQAGFHPQANVIAQFDPQTVGTPTHIFEVNLINKLKSHGAPNIGFDGNDPFVRNLLEDKIWRDQKNRHGRLLRRELEEVLEAKIKDIEYDAPLPPDDRDTDVPARTGRSREVSPRQSLENFLRFCLDRYPARHYILFLLGHGVVVGNDIFLFDEHVNDINNALSLTELGRVLTNFAKEVRHQDDEFELVAFHSCSVSSLEVAYELKGTARYMLASQGPAFVGSWPYRQILIRLFNDLVKCGGKIDVEKMLTKFFDYCMHNSLDFLLAGYSFDLALCNLKEVGRIKRPLKILSHVLVHKGFDKPGVRNLILLAHWRAQSFWGESYTDLYDFCFYLHKLCKEYACPQKTPEDTKDLKETLEAIQWACREVICHLTEDMPRKPDPNGQDGETEREGEAKIDKKIIARAAFTGPAYQYSHGLSVYFPWARPADDTQILREYRGYKFAKTCWLEFLEEYFDRTLRKTRKCEAQEENDLKGNCRIHQPEPSEEIRKNYEAACKSYEEESDDGQEDGQGEQQGQNLPLKDRFEELVEDIASLVYTDEGTLGNSFSLAGSGKTDPKDPTGDECTCPTIKNYPRDTRRRVRRGNRVEQTDSKRAALISDSIIKTL